MVARVPEAVAMVLLCGWDVFSSVFSLYQTIRVIKAWWSNMILNINVCILCLKGWLFYQVFVYCVWRADCFIRCLYIVSEGLSVLSGVVSDGASRAQACAGARLQPNLLRRRWWINAGAQRATAAGESSEHLWVRDKWSTRVTIQIHTSLRRRTVFFIFYCNVIFYDDFKMTFL